MPTRNGVRWIARRASPVVLLVAAAHAAPQAAHAQQQEMAAEASAQTMMEVLLEDVREVKQKLLGLVEAMPAESYDWRPGEGVRSVGEVFRHVTADNYLIPAFTGVAVPEGVAIQADDYATVQAFESEGTGKEGMAEALEESFGHLEAAMEAAGAEDLDRTVRFFGQERSARSLWVLTTTHLHEHLGQAIAYARTNGVVPPWSR